MFYVRIFWMNVILAAFLYLHVRWKSYRNDVWKICMFKVDEINTRSQFHQCFTRTFSMRKCFAQIFSIYVLASWLFGAQILAKKCAQNIDEIDPKWWWSLRRYWYFRKKAILNLQVGLVNHGLGRFGFYRSENLENYK